MLLKRKMNLTYYLYNFFVNKKRHVIHVFYLWSHLGSNQGPPDYESGALTN